MASSRIVFTPPEQAKDISGLADKALRRAGALGVLPTPIEDVIAAGKITDKSDEDGGIAGFLDTLGGAARETFKAIINKVRGVADFRKPVIYVPTDTRPRELFAKSHEMAHHDIPWHRVQYGGTGFLHDDDYTLGADVKAIFEQEANFYASEIIFQGTHFFNRATSYKPSFDAVFLLSDMHGASNQATLRRYVEVHDETIAAVTYLPSQRRFGTSSGLGVLNAPRLFASKKFLDQFSDVDLPWNLADDHPWAEARTSLQIPDGYIDLPCSGRTVSFWWQAWWNNYSLLVLLRREPRFKIIGRSVRAITGRAN